jgi:pimeloyl-ACP methyl ester carboxylesterase
MRVLCVLLSMLLNPAFMSSAARAQEARPIIVIPGILGSKLCDGAGAVVWGNRDSLWNFDRLALPFGADPETLAHRPCGLIESIQVAGPFRVHQYGPLLSYLNGLRNAAVRVFPYDWRLSNFYTARQLKRFIDESFPDPARKVDIVAHSMGGLVARIYIQELGGDKRVDRLVMMGTPHRGAGQVFKTVEQGWNWWQNAMAGGLPAIRETLLSFPSVYQLLPSYKNCCFWREKEYAPLEGEFSAFDETAWSKFGWLPSRFRTAEGQRFVAGALTDARRLAVSMREPIPATVRHANVVTGLITTQSKTYFNPRTGDFAGQEGLEGDGTVIEWSAANGAPSAARATQEEHQTIFEGPIAKKTLQWLLSNDTEPRAGLLTAFRGSLLDARGKEASLSSAAFEATPQVLRPGATGAITLRLKGDGALGHADLSNIRFTLDQDAAAKPLIVTIGPAQQTNDGIERTLIAPFSAPADFGVHSIAITIPGAATFDEYLVVLK